MSKSHSSLCYADLVTRLLLASALLLSSCSEQKVGAHNGFPTAMITSHSDGDVVPDDEVYVEGSVSDPDDPPESLRATWFVAGVEACEAAAPFDDGYTRCLVALSGGSTDIELRVLDPINALGQDKVSIEVVETTPPLVQIESPQDGDHFYTDKKIALIGAVSDAEDDPDGLILHWTSDITGRLDIETTVTSDGSVTAYADLEEGEHAVTLHAMDTHGKTGSDAVIISVGPPNTGPSCGIVSPVEGALLSPTEDTTLVGTATDADQDAHTLVAGWASDQDGDLGSSAPTTAGDVTFVASDLSAGTHVLTLTVSDELDETCTDSVVVQVGSPPEITITSPATGSVLEHGTTTTWVASVSDAEDTGPLLTVQWTSSVDGALGGGAADVIGLASLDAALSLGPHEITATVTDTHGQTSSDTITVAIDDVPVVSDVQILPDPAWATDGLSCSWTFADATGFDASLVSWTINGIAAGTGPTLSSGYFHSDTVTCTVTPSDGVLSGTPISESLIVSNSLPTITTVVISPASPTASDTLSCGYGGFSDADGEADASTLQWTIGGVGVGTSSTLTGAFSRGDDVVCTVTPHDGTDAGTPISQSVTIDNSPPEVLTVSLTPSTATTNSTLTAVVTTSDAESDPVTLSYAWIVDGLTVAETGSSLSGAVYFDKHQVVSVTLTPNDGFEDGAPMTSGSITIDNSPPTAPTILFIPEAPVEGEDDVWCAVDALAVDADGDGVSLSFTWQLDGAPWTGALLTTDETFDTVPLTETVDGQVWTCTVSTHDGEATGGEVSSEVTIDNAQTRVFVTQNPTSSDMGGPSGADAHCQTSADDAGLGGTWSAYVSGGGTSAIVRIAEGPYYRIDGVLIANDKADLVDGSIAAPINITETGGHLDTFVCTGATESGGSTGYDCHGWTWGCGVCEGDHHYVEIGDSSRTSDDWSTRGWNFCGSCYLYCFED